MKKQQTRRLLYYILTTLLIVALNASLANAQSADEIPSLVADNLTIDLVSAQLIVSAITMIITVSIAGYALYKTHIAMYAILAVMFATMFVLVGLGWMPYYIPVITGVVVGLMLATNYKELLKL